MSKTSKIGWTEHTASPWLGCTEVSPGCDNCYARTLTTGKLAQIIRRAYKKANMPDWETRPLWGNKATRVMSSGFWTNVRTWDREAGRNGERHLIFPSLMDWLDTMPEGAIDQKGAWILRKDLRAELLSIILETPNLTWQLLTKRPRLFRGFLADLGESPIADDSRVSAWESGKWHPANLWVGVTVENEEQAHRIKDLQGIPAAKRFISFEPLLGPIHDLDLSGIDWAIIGGESGCGFRPMDLDAMEKLVCHCLDSGLCVFVKQDSAFQPGTQGRIPDRLWNVKQVPDK